MRSWPRLAGLGSAGITGILSTVSECPFGLRDCVELFQMQTLQSSYRSWEKVPAANYMKDKNKME